MTIFDCELLNGKNPAFFLLGCQILVGYLVHNKHSVLKWMPRKLTEMHLYSLGSSLGRQSRIRLKRWEKCERTAAWGRLRTSVLVLLWKWDAFPRDCPPAAVRGVLGAWCLLRFHTNLIYAIYVMIYIYITYNNIYISLMHTYLSNTVSFYYSWRTFLLEIGADYTVISYFSMASGR